MKTIWKTTLTIVDVQHERLPKFARPVHAGLDPSGVPCLWWTVDTDEQFERRTIYIVGTGNPIPKGTRRAAYVGTFVLGAFVWHVFSPTGGG
jgi:hypothetical protein